MLIARISKSGTSGYYMVQSLELSDTLISDISNAELGERFTIEIIEMSEEKFYNLSEFTGW